MNQHAHKGLLYLLFAAWSQVQKRGILAIVSDVWTVGMGYARHRFLGKGAEFTVAGETYQTFRHTYNITWDTERAVEIPLALHYLQRYAGRRVLEVGNVLSHYHPVNHDIVDKYEQNPGIINADVIDFTPPHKYDLIMSISTLEHVGWDESPRDPRKVGQAIEHLRGLLAPGGCLLVTIPMGYNPHIDIQFDAGMIRFDEVHFMRRISSDAEWLEVPYSEVKGAKFGEPYRCANGLIVGLSHTSLGTSA